MNIRPYPLAATLVAILLIPSARADYSTTVSSLNPVTYWRLNETAAVPPGDVATNRGILGQAAAGLYLDGAAHPAFGIPGAPTDTAVNIPNTDHSWGPMRVRVPFQAALNPAGPFTAEFWARPDQQGATACPYASVDFSQDPRYGWLFYQDNPAGKWFIRLYTSAGNTAINGGTVTPFEWQHVVAVYDGANLSLYVNGVSVAGPTAVTGTFTPVTNPNIPLSIGGRGDGAAGSFGYGGDMDEVAFYTNVLTGAEILAHYQAGTNPATADYSALVLVKNPPGYWRLGEPAYVAPDPGTLPIAANLGSYGTSANGTDYPGITTGVAGPAGAGLGAGNFAYQFNGCSSFVDCGQPADLASWTGPLSVMTWMKVNQWSKDWQAMVTKGDSSWRLQRNSASAGSRVVGWGTTGLNPQDQAGTRRVDDGLWHHVVAVYDGTKKSIYVDGTLDAETAASGTLAANAYSIYIGENSQATGRYFPGAMDEVAIFTNSLSAAQILQVYNSAELPPSVTQVQRTPADPLFEGYNIAMTAQTLGALPITNQWYKSTTALPGQTNLTLSIQNAQTGDSGNYTIVARNAYGSGTSAVQSITVSAGPPLVLSQNIFNATRAAGGWVTYSVVAGGSSPISYQWKKVGGAPVPGATTSALTLRNLQLSDAGSYYVTLSNPYGTKDSGTGVVSVVTVTNFPFAAMYGAPLAYYRLNETSGTTAADIAGGLNGTLNGAITTGIIGPRPPAWTGFESANAGFQFAAGSANARVQLPPFNLKTNQITIVAWINPAGPQSDQTGILISRTSNGQAGMFIDRSGNGALSYLWSGTGSWNEFQSGLVPLVGQWNFVALVVEPTKGTVYLDDRSGSGLRSASYSASHQTQPFDSPNIGVDFGYTRWFDGGIDEVVVYDRALSAAEIANLALLGSEGPVAPRIVQQPVPATAFAGESPVMSVGALGALPLTYQWHHTGTNLPGATTANLTIANAHFTDAGNYDVLVSNSIGTSNSQSATLTVVAPPTFANLTNELVLHLKFDGDYLDSSGRANHAAPVNSPSFVGGRLGQAFHFNTDFNNSIINYATLGSFAPPDLVFGTSQNFSVSYWIRFTGASIDLPVFCNNDCGEGCVGYYFGPSVINNNGAWAWSLCNSSYAGPIAEGAPNSINNGNWHNVVSTFDRAGMAFTYLDGVMVDARPISGFTDEIDSGNPINIGQVGTANYGVNVNFGADVDDLGVWKRALSPVEAQSIYLAAQNGASFDTYGPVILSIRKAGNDIELIWQAGTLLQSGTVNGNYVPVPGAVAPYFRITPGPISQFFRIQL